MQKGIRKKSKDILFVDSIFYLAINLLIDISIITKKLNKLEYLLSIRLVYFPSFKIERACMYPTGKLMTN